MPIEKISFLPNQSALEQIANNVWEVSQRYLQRPLVILSTSGPTYQLRQILEGKRPTPCPIELAFLPTLFGLDQWLNLTSGLKSTQNVFSDFQRWEIVFKQLEIHQEISARLGIHGEASKWALSQSIVQGCDYLSSAYLYLTEVNEDGRDIDLDNIESLFQEALKRAYPNSESFVLPEANILLTFWKYISTIQDAPIRRQLSWKFRIQELLETNQLPPLIWVEFTQVKGAELKAQEEFLSQYGKLGHVYRLTPDWEKIALWPEAFSLESQSLSEEQKQSLVQKNRNGVIKDHWYLMSPPSFEKLAWATVQRVALHIKEDRKNIAIIAQDRLVVRRVRALLARYEGISIHDATGWKLSTTGVAAAINSWIEIVRSPEGPNLHQWMGFLKNPLIDWSQVIHKIDPNFDLAQIDNWMNYLDQQLLERMDGIGWSAIFNVFQRKSSDDRIFGSELNTKAFNTLSLKVIQLLTLKCNEWQGQFQNGFFYSHLLLTQLQQLEMAKKLEKDEAGQTFLSLLDDLMKMNGVNLQANSWFSLLDLGMEESSFTEKTSRSSINIYIIPLSAMRLHQYDAVLVVGCDDEHFPSKRKEGLIFSKNLMRELGLSSIEDDYQQQARDLSQLMQSHQYVDFLWQEYQKAGEKNRRTSWLTRLISSIDGFNEKSFQIESKETNYSPVKKSKAILGGEHPLLPSQLSPSSYKILRECPYRFYVTRSLKISSPKAYAEESIYGEIGQLLHSILDKFYRILKVESEVNQELSSGEEYRRAWMIQKLTEISNSEWLNLTQINGKFLGNQHLWNEQITTFINWQLNHEKNGWKVYQSEAPFEYDFKINDSYTIKIRGKIDRIDLRNEEALILDYKVQGQKKLQDREKHFNDDPQLLMYAMALDQQSISSTHPVNEVEWVSLKPDANDKEIYLSKEVNQELRRELEIQIQGDFQSLWQGKPLVASGPNHVCQYCDVRGICRKGMWSNE
jgi:ATP-dependent helicase/nuclease subunit B